MYTTILIAIITFLWYRKGRLWNYYDSILNASIDQIKSRSIDIVGWEKIVQEHCEKLGKELFNSLFRFEIDYLRNRIKVIQDLLWIPDSSTDAEKHIDYYDKEKYCKYIFKNYIYKDIRFCGLGLFFHAFKDHLIIMFKNEKEDTGHKIIYRK